MRAVREPHADGTAVTAPMLELTRCLMNLARDELGPEVDHTFTSMLAARANRVDFENLDTSAARGAPGRAGQAEPGA